jgi:excisionase family DNA binding protein
MESMMSARQVAELLGVHENWVYDQAVSGELPSYKIGGTRRFDPDELRGWIADHREPENGRQIPRKSARRVIATATSRRGVQHAEQRSDLEQQTRVSRKRGEKTVRVEDGRQPRLFET